jgi:hypothetical protein
MLFTRLKNISFFSRIPLLGLLFLINACTDLKKAIVHDYPKEKAFVFDNKIVIKDPENKTVLRDISYNLDNYWDDSLKVRKIRQFGVFSTIVQPTTYYPERIERTIQYMQNYLATKGYNQPTLNLQTRVDTVKNEWRVYLKMEVSIRFKVCMDGTNFQKMFLRHALI